MLYRALRTALFQLDAETAHHRVMKLASTALGPAPIRAAVRAMFDVRDRRLEQTVFGIDFPNPVGLAAGFDKNAQWVNTLGALGFGHVEIGTVTGEGQSGNPKPRLFRLTEDGALLNRMGFNNAGSRTVRRQLRAYDAIEPILGVNIGKTKAVDLEVAPDDYEKSFRRLFEFARYFVVNVSSPNTPGLRELQSRRPLTRLLGRLQTLNDALGDEHGTGRRPLLVKISPDLSDPQIEDVVGVVEECDVDGVVATNTTIGRDGLHEPDVESLGPGGISGAPLRKRSVEVISILREGLGEDVPIVGVGGIFTARDALAAMRAGATLIQVWTGFVYEGPEIAHDINLGLLDACEANGWTSIAEARHSRA